MNNKGITTTFTYDALGRRTSMTHANGVVTNYLYDAASQLTRLAHQLGAATINSFDYSYDKVGNRKSKADSNGTANYTYDTLNRLVEAINPLPSNPLESFQYDAVGNRTTSNQNGASVFNQANQLEEDASFRYVYDANGNLTRKTNKTTGELTQFEYTAENQLVRVVRNGTTINYRYDGLGRRVEKEVNDGATTKVTRYILDQEDVLLELDGSNNIVVRYTHGPGIDEPLILEKGGESFFYHADGLGTITEITDSAGSLKQQYTYSSFGKIESQLDPNFIQPYTFTGREFDPETGLYFYRARYYDPSTGRFLQEDALKGLITAPPSLNLYPYVANNPLNAIDPSGRIVFNLAAAAIGTAIGGTIGGIQAAINGENVLVGIGVGAGAGLLSGITLGAAGGLTLGFAAGFGGNAISQVANNLIAGRPLNFDLPSALVSGVEGAVGAYVALPVSGVLNQAVVGGVVAGIGDILGQLGLQAVRREAGIGISPSEARLLAGGFCPLP